jgi:SAM-dependent methyltransferase
MLSSGSFQDEPLRSFIAGDPWGENPLPYLGDARWLYVQCVDCALTFHRRVLSPEWAERKFMRWQTSEAISAFESRQDPRAKFERAVHFTRHVLQLEKLCAERPLRVLDFGCGDGAFIEQCRLYGFEAVGVDRASARAERNRGTLYADIREVSGPFHVITMFEVLEHLEEPRRIVEALKPLLIARGILIIETPDASGVRDIRSLRDYQMIHPLDHINGFTPQTLREFAERLGFRQITPPVSHATTDTLRVIKSEARRIIRGAPSTQQYFRLL